MTNTFNPLPGDDLFAAIPPDMPARGMLQEMKAGPLVLLYKRIFRRFGITPRGVIHLGGHVGQEIIPYLMIGYDRALFVEPDDQLFASLSQNLAFANGLSGFADSFVGSEAAPWGHALKVAVGETNGVAKFYVQPKNTQENSILKPIVGSHEGIEEVSSVVEVPMRTVDALMGELPFGWRPSDFNVLYANIEGAELLAFRGAESTLKHIDFVFSEVNLKAHYEGNPTASDLEGHLAARGFKLSFTCGGFLPDTGYMAFTRT